MTETAKKNGDVAEVEILRAQVPTELADRMRELAAAGERTLSAQIRIAVREHVEASARAAA